MTVYLVFVPKTIYCYKTLAVKLYLQNMIFRLKYMIKLLIFDISALSGSLDNADMYQVHKCEWHCSNN